jgi:hypothetical protein
MPQPKHTPWLRNNCHISVTKDDPMKERVSKNTPMSKTVRVPSRPVKYVASGAIRRAVEMESPPIKAKER